MNTIYVIEKVWTDSWENTTGGAIGYVPFAYVTSKDDAIKICKDSKMLTSKDCWAIGDPIHSLRYKEVKEFHTIVSRVE